MKRGRGRGRGDGRQGEGFRCLVGEGEKVKNLQELSLILMGGVKVEVSKVLILKVEGPLPKCCAHYCSTPQCQST